MKIRQVVVTDQLEVELQTSEINTQELGPDEAIITTEYTYISTGTEIANYSGHEPKVFQADQWCTYPWKSGYANVGYVEEIGANVKRISVGDRVFTYGNHASVHRYNTQRLAVTVPEGIESGIAAASRMAGVAMTAPIISEIVNDPWVIVFGLGMVGNLAAQAYNILGCRVIGVDPVQKRRSVAEKCGISYTVGGEPDEVQAKIENITNGELGNITVDAVGHSSVIMQSLKATATYGQLVILGTPRVSVEGDLTDLLSETHLRWITIKGALEWCLPMYPTTRNAESQFSKQNTIFSWLATNQLQLAPLISHCLKPEHIKQAYDGLLYQPDIYTGVLLEWS